MIKLCDFLNKNSFFILDVDNSKHFIQVIVDKTIQMYGLAKLEKAKSKLVKEKSICHGIELTPQFLLSHTRSDLIDDIVFTVGLSDSLVGFSKTLHVKVVLFILIPPHKSKIYLSLIAKLSRFLMDTDVQDLFLQCDVDGIVNAMQKFD